MVWYYVYRLYTFIYTGTHTVIVCTTAAMKLIKDIFAKDKIGEKKKIIANNILTSK